MPTAEEVIRTNVEAAVIASVLLTQTLRNTGATAETIVKSNLVLADEATKAILWELA